MRSALIPAGAYVSLAITAVWPAFRDLGTVVPGAEGTEVWTSYWVLQHFMQSVQGLQSPFLVETLNYPQGGAVFAPNTLDALFAFPFTSAFGPASSMSFLIMFQLAFTGWTMHLFSADFLKRGLDVENPRWGPWMSGITLMMSSLMMGHVYNGSTEALSAGWTILAIWWTWRATHECSIQRAALAGALLALASAAHVYGGIVAFVFAGALSLNVQKSERRGAYTSLVVAILTGLVLTGLAMFTMSQLSDGSIDLYNAFTVQSAQEIARSTGAADPLAYVRPGNHPSAHLQSIVTGDVGRQVHVHYLGLVAVGLTLWTLWMRYRSQYRFLIVAGFACLLLSLGPVWVMNGRPVLFSGDLAVPLPFLLLEVLPGFASLHAPWRLALGPVIVVSFMVGAAVDQQRLRFALCALIFTLLDGQMLSPIAEQPRHAEVKIARSIRGLADAPDGAVIYYPFSIDRVPLLEQTVHRKPIAGTLKDVSNPRADRLWRRIRASATHKPDVFHSAVSSTAKRLGIRYLVIHTDPDAEPDVYTAAVAKIEKLFPIPEWGQGQTRVVPLW